MHLLFFRWHGAGCHRLAHPLDPGWPDRASWSGLADGDRRMDRERLIIGELRRSFVPRSSSLSYARNLRPSLRSFLGYLRFARLGLKSLITPSSGSSPGWLTPPSPFASRSAAPSR